MAEDPPLISQEEREKEESEFFNSEEYRQGMEDYQEYAEKHERGLVIKGFFLALVERCRLDDNGLRWYARWWYAVKLMLCIIFRLHPNEKIHGDYYARWNIDVATVHSAQLYAGWEADWLSVGHGVFENWYYELEHDSDWFM